MSVLAHLTERLRNLPAPIVTVLLIALGVLAVATWGHRPERGSPVREIVKVSRTKAKLTDGTCMFSADVEVASTWSRMAFARHYLSVRDALVDVLRTKSRYMVNTSTSREALRLQMVDAVNRVIGAGRATRLRFTEFVLL